MRNDQRGVSVLVVLGLLALAVGGYIGWKVYERAQVKAEKQRVYDSAQAARREFTRLQAQWKDSLTLAASTPRIGLAGPMQRLQSVRQEVELVLVPTCLQQGKDQLVAGMNSALEGMMAFMRNDIGKYELDELTANKMQAMQRHFSNYENSANSCPAP